MILVPNSESLREFNSCHSPGGSEKGGQFCAKDSTGAAALPNDRASSPAFKEWFGDSKVVDANGKPLRVYHGSLSSFDEFFGRGANVESDSGAGFYFTSNVNDANLNYSTLDGADIDLKVQYMVEELEQEYESDEFITDQINEWVAAHPGASVGEASIHLARERLGITNKGVTIPVYLQMSNPAVLDTPQTGISVNAPDNRREPLAGETYLDFENNTDEESDDYRSDPTGKLADFMDAISSHVVDFDGEDIGVVLGQITDEAMDYGGMRLSRAISYLKKDPRFRGYSDGEGKLVSNEIIRRALRDIGFDGIIDRTVWKKFHRMKGMTGNTVHYIVFKPEQVKSAIGNKGTYNKKSRKFTEWLAR